MILEVLSYSCRRMDFKHLLFTSCKYSRCLLSHNLKLCGMLSNRRDLIVIKHPLQMLDYFVRSKTDYLDMRLKGDFLHQILTILKEKGRPLRIDALHFAETYRGIMKSIHSNNEVKQIIELAQPRKICLKMERFLKL